MELQQVIILSTLLTHLCWQKSRPTAGSLTPCLELGAVLMEQFSWIVCFLLSLLLDGRRYASDNDGQYYKLVLEDFCFSKAILKEKLYIIYQYTSYIDIFITWKVKYFSDGVSSSNYMGLFTLKRIHSLVWYANWNLQDNRGRSGFFKAVNYFVSAASANLSSLRA